MAVTEDLFAIWLRWPRDDIAEIGMRGELETATVARFRHEFDRALAKEARCVVVDLAEVSFIDSLGLAALIDGARRTETSAGERCFAVTAARTGVARLLSLTAVDRMIPTYETVAKAVDALSADRRDLSEARGSARDASPG